MAALDFSLHTKQQEVFFSPARFKVCAAGRRGGKTFLAAVILIIEALKDETDWGKPLGPMNAVWYVAPTYQQAKDIMWATLKVLAAPVAKQIKEKELTIIMPNDRMIVLKGSDREETLRGISLSYVVLDEYADMKAHVFDVILSPALSDCRGGTLFIGTPKGKNHFFDLWCEADTEDMDDWEPFHFCSIDNPMIDPAEIESARRRMTAEGFAQEYEAKFSSGGSGGFKVEHFQYIDELPPGAIGTRYMAVDPNGFKETAGMSASKMKRLDETAIAVVEMRPEGWYVLDIIHGRWGIRETSVRIVKAAQRYRPALVGVENIDAIRPYMEDQMRRLNVFPTLQPLKHMGQRKVDRIMWALQGRFENKRIFFLKGAWNQPLIDQLLDFPSPLSHDDLPDALAYIDQLGSTVFCEDTTWDDWEPLDPDAGY